MRKKIPLHVQKRPDGGYFITSPDIPYFSAIEEKADTEFGATRTILQKHLEQNEPDARFSILEFPSPEDLIQNLSGTVLVEKFMDS